MSNDAYNPAAISDEDVRRIIARVDRYVKRHGTEYGEAPVPGGDMDEASAIIVADWQGLDWATVELTYLARNGRCLFTPDLSDMGRHLRAALFCAGRARRRGWVMSSSDRRARRADARRRDMDDSPGASMASRAVDPARLAAAVEEAEARGLPCTSRRQRARRLRWVKTRNTHGVNVEIVARHADRTDVRFVEWTRYNFRRAGSDPLRVEDNAHYVPTLGIGRVVRSRPNPAQLPGRRRIPAGVTRNTLREAITG